MDCVHYPYARTNGASHRRLVVNASHLGLAGYLLHVMLITPSLLVTILYSKFQLIMILLFEKAEINI